MGNFLPVQRGQLVSRISALILIMVIGYTLNGQLFVRAVGNLLRFFCDTRCPFCQISGQLGGHVSAFGVMLMCVKPLGTFDWLHTLQDIGCNQTNDVN